MEIVKALALLWAGACIRNEKDRDTTLKFFNGIGATLEKTVKDFIPKGGAGNEQEPPKAEYK